jgi:glutamyl-tRNA synthetase
LYHNLLLNVHVIVCLAKIQNLQKSFCLYAYKYGDLHLLCTFAKKQIMIRVRFAPSPTGPLHIGGVRTALYNYLFAKKNNGKLILRIEDTDQARFVEGAENYIIESFKWCGIEFDEGVGIGGPHAPYRQSERKEIYKKYAAELIEKGKAYYAFDTPEELAVLRQKLEEEKANNTSYGAVSRMQMKNSLSLSSDEVEDLITKNIPYVIRFKMPENENVVMQDMIRGEVKVNSSTLDDKVLFKSDGLPTYHLANIIDDHIMEISHVIRGEEWLPSLPLHKMLYDAFEWEAPVFAHLPLLLKPSGKGKLSKRDGDKLGFPVFPLEWTDPKTNDISKGYREDGYFNDAFINMLSLLGWNPGDEKEIFSMEELIEAFDINKVSKSGARFDPEKAVWFNHQYLLHKNASDIVAYFLFVLKGKGIETTIAFATDVCDIIKERVNFVHEIWGASSYLFQAPQSFDEKSIKKKWEEGTSAFMEELAQRLDLIESFTPENIKSEINAFAEEKELGMGKVMNAFRIALVGSSSGIDMMDICRLLGKKEVLERMNYATKYIN